MTVLSVDLAHKSYSDVGAVVLDQGQGGIHCELLPVSLNGTPSPATLADHLDGFCRQRAIRLLLLDGPQGWKSKDNGLKHSRLCERELNTPAKTGDPTSVKPANYGAFVRFSIALYDALETRGWERLSKFGVALGPACRVLIESFPLSAWRSLGIAPLPAKRKARFEHLRNRLDALKELFPLRLSAAPTHDQLQALVSGLAGLAVGRDEWDACAVAGVPPVVEEQYWREGFIVNPKRPICGPDEQKTVTSNE